LNSTAKKFEDQLDMAMLPIALLAYQG